MTVEPAPLEWKRAEHWLPHFTGRCPSGVLEGWFCAPVDERGIMVRLAYHHHAPEPVTVELGWAGSWGTTTVTHLRSKPIASEPVGHDDPWTGSRTISASRGSPAPVGGVARRPWSGARRPGHRTAMAGLGGRGDRDRTVTDRRAVRRGGHRAGWSGHDRPAPSPAGIRPAMGDHHPMVGRSCSARPRGPAGSGGAHQLQSLLQLLLRARGLPRHRSAGDGDVAEPRTTTCPLPSGAGMPTVGRSRPCCSSIPTGPGRSSSPPLPPVGRVWPTTPSTSTARPCTRGSSSTRPPLRSSPSAAMCDDRRQDRSRRARGAGRARRAGRGDRTVAPSPVGPVRHLLGADRRSHRLRLHHDRQRTGGCGLRGAGRARRSDHRRPVGGHARRAPRAWRRGIGQPGIGHPGRHGRAAHRGGPRWPHVGLGLRRVGSDRGQ